MMVKYIAITVFFLIVSVCKPSYAMGKLGHQIVCQLAFEHLSSVNQDKITHLLNAIPTQHQHLINHYNYKKKDKPITFDNACTWADAIKRIEEYRPYSAWHYLNVPRSNTHISVNECSNNCLPQAILTHQKRLVKPEKAESKREREWQKIQSLLFLGHWLGDIHQPLHISFADDKGGNKIKFSHYDTKCGNLHWYWDECIFYKEKNSKRKWLELLRSKWKQSSQPSWQAKQVWQWADESFQITTQPSFNYCQLTSENHCEKPKGNIKLPENYLDEFQPIMEQRLLQAAQRLTKVLEVSL